MRTTESREGRGVRILGRIVAPTALATLAMLAACGGGGDGPTGVSSGTLDANAINASGTRVQSVVSQPLLAAIFAQTPGGASLSLQRVIPGAARVLPHILTSATRLVPSARLASPGTAPTISASVAPPHAGLGGGAAIIPDSLLGKTLVPDAQGLYHVSATATGAPTNGVRFVVRTPGSTQDLGYADLTDSMNGGTETLTLDVKTTAGAVLLHDVETSVTTSATDGTDSYTGYATNGTDRIDYAVTSQTTATRSIAITTLSAPSANVAAADTSVLDGMTSSDVNVTDLTINGTKLRFTNGAVANKTLGGYAASDTTNVSVNGAPFARIVIPSSLGNAVITGPTGGPLSPADQQALVAAEGVLLSASMVMIASITVVLWLLIATGI